MKTDKQKKVKTKVRTFVKALALSLLLALPAGISAQVVIGMDDKPESGAILQLKETNNAGANALKGLLLPRVKITIQNPATPELLAESLLGVPTSERWDLDTHIGLLVFHVGDASRTDELAKPNIFVWTKDDGWLLVKAN